MWNDINKVGLAKLFLVNQIYLCLVFSFTLFDGSLFCDLKISVPFCISISSQLQLRHQQTENKMQ